MTVSQIPNSSSYPSISMLNLAKFCCQKPKTLLTTLIWGGGEVFFDWKIDFLFCLNSFVQDANNMVLITWKRGKPGAMLFW